MQNVTIASTRLLEEGLKAEALRHHIQIIDNDFVAVSYIDNPELAGFLKEQSCPFVFTSKHAVESVRRLAQNYGITLTGKQAYGIRGNTSSLVQQCGFTLLGEAPNAALLAPEIVKQEVKKVIHLTANIRRNELYKLLSDSSIEVITREVYKKEPKPRIIPKYDGVLFFSPSQVDAFTSVNKLLPSVPVFCIGPTTADHLHTLNHYPIITAPVATEQAVLQQVYKYYQVYS